MKNKKNSSIHYDLIANKVGVAKPLMIQVTKLFEICSVVQFLK